MTAHLSQSQYRMNTKKLDNKPLASKYSNEASSSGGSNEDQEMGVYSNSTNGEAMEEDQHICWCFTSRADLITTARGFSAEFLGTFILLFCICGIIASTQLLRGEVGLMEYAATGGLTIVVVIFAIGPISGAHVNPAVTVAFAILGQLPWSKVHFYFIAQLLGSLFATYAGASVYGIKAELVTTRPLNGWSTAFWAEFFATFLIVFLAALMSYETPPVGRISGFVLGVAISLAILITGPVSGGSLNPARSLGPAIVAWRFDHIWLYVVAPTSGAAVGAYLTKMLRLGL